MTDFGPTRFEQIIADNQSRVFSLALHFLRDRETAEELAQDVFLQLYTQLHLIESADHATWWLRRAICHRCIDESRKRKYRPRIGLDDAPEPLSRHNEADFLLNERLQGLIAELPEHARIAVMLRYQEDLDPSEIALVLEVPVSTVKSRLHRALSVLKGRLSRMEVCS